MALVRLISLRISPSPLPFHKSTATRLFNPSSSSSSRSVKAAAHRKLLLIRPCCSFSTSPSSSTDAKSSEEVVAVSKTKPPSSSSSQRQLWNQPWGNISPFQLNEGLGSFRSALVNLSENLNNLLRSWSPFRLLSSRMKEHEDYYKFKIPVPGLSKEELKVTVDDRYLVITGEHKEEEEGGSSDADDIDGWYSRSFGYYNTSLLLPDDAKADEIKAELKNGVLNVTIPRSGEGRKNVREVEIQ